MATVYAQVLGHNATDYNITSTSEQVAVNALAAHDAVTVGTDNFSGTEYCLYGDHAYAIIGYNAYNSTFILYNPWGMDQPGQLTWGELQATTGPSRWPTLPARSRSAAPWARRCPSRPRCRNNYPGSSPTYRLPKPPPRCSCNPASRRQPPTISLLPRPAHRVICLTTWAAVPRCIRTARTLPARRTTVSRRR